MLPVVKLQCWCAQRLGCVFHHLHSGKEMPSFRFNESFIQDQVTRFTPVYQCWVHLWEKFVSVLLSVLMQEKKNLYKWQLWHRSQTHGDRYFRLWWNFRKIVQLHVRLGNPYQSSYPLTSPITPCLDLCKGQMVTLATGDSKKPRKTVLQCAITGEIN